MRQELIKPYKPQLKRGFPDTYDGSADLYVYFYDQGLKLLKPGGRLSYVVTNKWMRAGYAEGLRGVFAEKAWVEFVADFGHAKKFFPDADVFPSVIVVRTDRGRHAERYSSASSRVTTYRKRRSTKPWPRRLIRYRGRILLRTTGTLEPPDVVRLRKRSGGTAHDLRTLQVSVLSTGIKTGLNQAFVIDAQTRDKLIHDDSEVCARLNRMFADKISSAGMHRGTPLS